MKHDVSRLRQRVEELGARHRGARIPRALRGELAAYAAAERATGRSCRVIAERLGVSAESIRRWTGRTSIGNGEALVPVRVVTEPAATLTVWSPTGYRVDGLSVPEVAELLRRLA